MSMSSRPMIAEPCSSCAVCGSNTIRVDEVDHVGRMLLHQCGRCHHRWTEQIAIARRPMLRVFPTTKVAAAA